MHFAESDMKIPELLLEYKKLAPKMLPYKKMIKFSFKSSCSQLLNI